MKTIRQIADEIGVSKQAVYDKIKKEPLLSDLKNLTVKVDNTLHYELDGEQLIKSAFNKKEQSSVSSKSSKELDCGCQDLIDSLKGAIIILEQEIEFLREQLKVKDEQLERLDKRFAEAQILHADTKNLLSAPTEKSIDKSLGLFARIKKLIKKDD